MSWREGQLMKQLRHLWSFVRSVWHEMTYDYRSEFAYLRALDDVYDHALEDWNPCHDRVRDWIRERRKEVAS